MSLIESVSSSLSPPCVRLLVFGTAQGILLFEEDFAEGFHSFADDEVLKRVPHKYFYFC